MKLITCPLAIMVIVVVLVRLCMGCSSEEKLPDYEQLVAKERAENWDCEMHRDGFNEAFLGCVEKMNFRWSDQKEPPGAYSVPECKQYAYKLYCEPVPNPCTNAVKNAEKNAQEREREKWSRRLESMCDALKGTCFELNMASKIDHECNSACDFGEPEPVVAETDSDEEEKEAQ